MPTDAAAQPDSVHVATARLTAATNSGIPCPPVRDLLGTTDLAIAYAVQQRLTENRIADGATVTGRKIGLTSPAVQRQLGVDQPDFGVLFADMDVSSLPEIPPGRLLQPKAEAEIAFQLDDDLFYDDIDIARVRAAISRATAALEIVDSRIANWDITITDTIADNGSSGLYVLSENWVALDDFEPREVAMALYADDVIASTGTGAACLGDPLNAVVWLARTAHKFGQPLRAGQIILSGALGPMVPAPPGTTIRAELTHLGAVATHFAKEDS